MPKRSKKRMVWIDCEMTGLEPSVDTLLEIATIITDYDLNIIEHGPVLAIRTSEARLAAMDAWNRRTHKKSGLLDRVRTQGVTVSEAEKKTLSFIRRHCYKRTAPLCGNSIGQDKRFLAKYMPKLHDFLHYKVVDVSSIKLLASEWYGKAFNPPKKQELHRALSDIEESIAELAYLRTTVFVRQLSSSSSGSGSGSGSATS
ncbi:MAG TPA: oligoribonuclease [Thermoanaerobaculia bacterium]|jgi:oligoribonuclease|nr:oligoribonuclease [Thermoanaerobaculia bacterium]